MLQGIDEYSVCDSFVGLLAQEGEVVTLMVLSHDNDLYKIDEFDNVDGEVRIIGYGQSLLMLIPDYNTVKVWTLVETDE